MNMKLKTLILTFSLLLGLSATVFAQSMAVKKAADAAFTLTTFKADGSNIEWCVRGSKWYSYKSLETFCWCE